MSPGRLAAMRLQLLRIAADISPRLTGGVRAYDVVERAREMELYVCGPEAGSGAQPSADPGAETGAPPPLAADAPPAVADEADAEG